VIEETLAAVAYVAGRLVGGKTSSAIYDYSRSMYVKFGGDVRPGRVQIYDYEDSSHIAGNGSAEYINLFHYGRSAHIRLNIAGHNFNGFDFGRGAHFSGSVSGQNVSLYDYESSTWHQYSLV
jgi:hypothetical protein